MKKAVKILIPILILVSLIVFLVVYNLNMRVASNPDGTIGNTPGNLLNGGLFCELDGVIYFSNPYDKNNLYSMNLDMTNVRKLNNDSAFYINAAGNHLYYAKKNQSESDNGSVIERALRYGIIRCKTNGLDAKTLVSNFCTDLSLSKDTLIYNTTENSIMGTYTVPTTGGKKTLLINEDINNAGVSTDGYIVYSNTLTDHFIYRIGVNDQIRSLYVNVNAYNALPIDNFIYYIDLDNKYALTRINTSTLVTEVLTTDHVINYNVYDNVIYYASEGNDVTGDTTHALKRYTMLSGTTDTIMEGDFTSISCTSKYTFFQAFNDAAMYFVDTYNGVTVYSIYSFN